MKIRIALLIAGLILMIVAACTPKLYTPAPETVRDPSMDLAQLSQGRTIYMDHCGKCHKLRQPKQYSADSWNKVLDKMQPKAKISDEQRRLVYLYLTSQK